MPPFVILVTDQVINFDVSECHTNKLFGNKIWQATKFALMWIDKVALAQDQFDSPVVQLSLIDKWILSRLCRMLSTVQRGVESYDFYLATTALKNFLYYEFCDVYLVSFHCTSLLQFYWLVCRKLSKLI